ncbi:DUF4304 domain-containing protein [Sphingobacterium sp. SRCM116780]|uniref:DUF4304 domain-containing protein n=1 Tax=Sphingobacterium sp. SRCM116780 TaxID=2907623 RepID=UPI001F1D31BF|nr:DUF4304 domain-containing protein [Sphingobacterium sp. SRCM116780]UIR57851.1 DUF4304 domain-containing protein [Sphingobacterium sp. SRCM116780]
MDILKEITKSITPFIKEKGYSKKGNSFHLKSNNNFGIINFQKSQDGNKDEAKFTINFGVYSDLLGKVVDFDYDNSKVPDVWSSQWQARIGHFMPDGHDFWWKVQAEDNLYEITSNIIDNIQNIILPEIDKRLTDEGLMKSLIKGDFIRSTAVEKFKYLTIFLKATGDIEALNEVVEKFMQQDGKKYHNIVKEHLEEIEYRK